MLGRGFRRPLRSTFGIASERQTDRIEESRLSQIVCIRECEKRNTPRPSRLPGGRCERLVGSWTIRRNSQIHRPPTHSRGFNTVHLSKSQRLRPSTKPKNRKYTDRFRSVKRACEAFFPVAVRPNAEAPHRKNKPARPSAVPHQRPRFKHPEHAACGSRKPVRDESHPLNP